MTVTLALNVSGWKVAPLSCDSMTLTCESKVSLPTWPWFWGGGKFWRKRRWLALHRGPDDAGGWFLKEGRALCPRLVLTSTN